jgi:IS5 family transposase
MFRRGAATRRRRCGLTLSTVNFDKHSKLTRRAKFLAEMDRVVPWRELCAIIAPYYPKALCLE